MTLTHGLLLLLFSFILSSCQRNHFKTSGLYTHYNIEELQRAPASAQEDSLDLKQIIIYCRVSSLNQKQCFIQQYKKIVLNRKGNNKNIATGTKALEKLYTDTGSQVDIITQKILSSLEDKLTHFAHKQTKFCQQNATHHFEKCLNANLKSHTMTILNAQQTKTPELNGHEYLYLKSKIKNALKEKTLSQKAVKSIRSI